MTINSYKDLLIWQRGVDVAIKIYEITKKYPNIESYSITNQMRRAACSVSTNVAEGWTRGKRDSMLHYLDIANGSIAELETFLVISRRLNYLSETQQKEIESELIQIGKMINGLKAHLKSKPKDSKKHE